MMEHNIGCFASDLWALGCIIFECLTGGPAFTGRNRFEIEDKILCSEVEFPPDFDKDAKDLVQKLLQVHPEDRLGAGKPGSKNDLKALKKHKFFKNKKFSQSAKMVPALDTLEIKVDFKKYTDQFEESLRSGPKNSLQKTGLSLESESTAENGNSDILAKTE